MVRAIEAIGRGVVASEAVPFSLPADHSASKPEPFDASATPRADLAQCHQKNATIRALALAP